MSEKANGKAKEFAIDTCERAVANAAEVALTMLTVGQAFYEIDWLNVLSVSAVAGVITVLKCIVKAFPKSNT